MDRDCKSRAEIEELWGERLKAAQRDYEKACTASRMAMQQLGEKWMPSPDGCLAVRQANAREKAALDEYVRVLKIFHDLVVKEELPPED